MSEMYEAVAHEPVIPTGRGRLIVRRFLRNKPAVAGVLVLALMLLAAFVLPYFLPYDHEQVDKTAFHQPPSAAHWFGTTEAGQDVLAQTLRGLQKSLIIGVCVAFLTTLIAAVVGSIAGYVGGWTDRTIMWVVDLLLVVPSFILIVVFAPRIKSSGSMWLLIALIAVFGWMVTARMVRSMALSLRDREYLRAARYMGASTPRVIASHIIPNIASILVIDLTLNVGAAILAETGLSYLGFGVQPPDVSLGTLIERGTNSALTSPWLFLPAGTLLVITVLAANLAGDGLRDAVDPNAKRARKVVR